ncbi:MAG TPA: hypothetical protein VJ917_03560 [Saprospiraceae bacterium]|nr:hypothetical protein [Saprospiraceae bacterium]
MAKKNFNKGLEDIFKKDEKENNPETEVLEQEKRPVKEKKHSETLSRKKLRKKSSRKNFTFDLNNLLSEALQSTDEDDKAKSVDETRSKPKKRINKVPLTGINALIRKTIDSDYDSDAQREFKRVTFICDRDKVARLKQIAKSEKTYLKDILIDLIEEYIADFEKSKASQN